MANRTIYLPDQLDEASRRLGLNLSRLTQEAIERYLESDETADAPVTRLDAAVARIRTLGIEWPVDVIANERLEAGER